VAETSENGVLTSVDFAIRIISAFGTFVIAVRRTASRNRRFMRFRTVARFEILFETINAKRGCVQLFGAHLRIQSCEGHILPCRNTRTTRGDALNRYFLESMALR